MGNKNESNLGRISVPKSGQSRNTEDGGEQGRKERRELLVMKENTKTFADQEQGVGGREAKRTGRGF